MTPRSTRSRAAAAQLARDAAPLAGGADAARRRRARADAARQQQRLVPGQRDLVVRLGARRAAQDLLEFSRRLLELRRSHPVFRRTHFLDGGPEDGPPRRWWFRPDGRQMTQRDWQRAEGRELGVFLNGGGWGAEREGEPASTTRSSCSFNAHFEDVDFPAAEPRGFGRRWALELSTAEPQAQPGRQVSTRPASP